MYIFDKTFIAITGMLLVTVLQVTVKAQEITNIHFEEVLVLGDDERAPLEY
ncbi:hypothetical protein [Gracilimonas sp.]|uniref:hypothetical protein n=1 Tax=Gracilimonas sp. TaxID=1974203 RepID=UPI002871446A|nr:hypothetical protein [Gracilimonas sp.]